MSDQAPNDSSGIDGHTHLDAASKIMDRITKLEATIKEQNELMDRLPHWHYITAPHTAEGDVGADITSSGTQLSSENQQYVSEPEVLEATYSALNTTRSLSPARRIALRASPPVTGVSDHSFQIHLIRESGNPATSGSCTDRTAFQQLCQGPNGVYGGGPQICEPTTLSSLTSESISSLNKLSTERIPNWPRIERPVQCQSESAATQLRASCIEPLLDPRPVPAIYSKTEGSTQVVPEYLRPEGSTSETLLNGASEEGGFFPSSAGGSEALNRPRISIAAAAAVDEHQKLSCRKVSELRSESYDFYDGPNHDSSQLATGGVLETEIHFDVPSLLSIFESKRSQRQSQAKYLNHRLDQLVKERERKLKQLHDLELEVTQLRSKLTTGSSETAPR